MGSAIIGAGDNIPHLAKVRGIEGVKTYRIGLHIHVAKSILYTFGAMMHLAYYYVAWMYDFIRLVIGMFPGNPFGTFQFSRKFFWWNRVNREQGI